MQRPYCTWSRPRIVSADTASQFGAGTEFFVDQQSCVVAFAQERHHQAQNAADLRIRKTVDELCAPRSPVQALHLVSQNDPGYRKALGEFPKTFLLKGQAAKKGSRCRCFMKRSTSPSTTGD